ncbi:heterokaryon incompatibility protein-domain-containing protein [Chaetomium fimeti]|uniref:Heterokaryon incompatibility protein-domain-containing protein n=1 Tax=Chaetomium fimeti TaxID=1854472 RepID=A0AAE0HQ35_9PEZI|nr:heterokaryon incompatibility protein-domain-containing protein [Chaetomium fimeti]
MLCTNCHAQLRDALDSLDRRAAACHDVLLEPPVYRSTTHALNLVGDLRDFHNSILLGCFICRRIWRSISSWAHGRRDDFQRAIPETYSEFTSEVSHIDHLTGRSDPTGSHPFPSGIHAEVVMDRTYKHGKIFVEGLGGGNSGRRWMLRFSLRSAKKRNSRVQTGSISVEALGASTASVPQLWDRWFRTCLSSHHVCRSLEPRDASGFVPKRLIKVLPPAGELSQLKWHLIFPNGTEPIDYVTLGHCWGSHQPTQLTDSTLPAFSQKGSAEDLPKTYRDALQIALTLGIPYIWIDSLCIKQDDKSDWLEQSPLMASIYGNARCNIAATWASDWTEGCFSKRDPFMVVGTTVDTSHGKGYQIHLRHGWSDEVTDTPLNRRGWVVQERCLAPRQLVFTKHQVYWECAEHVASEQFPDGLPEGMWQEDSATTLLFPSNPKPRLLFESEQDCRNAWCSLVEQYSMCRLTQRSDKMIAIASLAESLRKHTGDTYLAGLWEKDLLDQLYWHQNLFTWDEAMSPTRNTHAPSWSWASLDAHIQTDEAYHSDPGRMHLAEVLGVSVVSDHPAGLHSFTSAELQIRAIALWATYTEVDGICTGYRKDYVVSIWCPREPGSQSRGYYLADDDDINFFWDEYPTPGDGLAESENRRRLQEQRSSELLLFFLSFTKSKSRSWNEMEGLILSRTRRGTFVRVGCFSCSETILDEVINKGLGRRLDLGSRINLSDPGLSSLVRSVTIL